MSYILDALKKSDHERSRERGPTLASVHGGWQPQAPWIRRHGLWLAAVGVLLLVGAGGAWLLLQPGAGLQPDRTAAPAAEESAIPEVEKGRVERQIDAGTAPDKQPTVAEPIDVPAALPSRAIQELWELPDPVRATFPALTFSFHVYADTPARRTIIINNRRYSEGDTINSETRLEEITEQGVILRFREYRVYIPIINDW